MDADQHVAMFNDAVNSGDWSSFVDRFAHDATLEFVFPAGGPNVGPFTGRAAIAAAYAAEPPDDTISISGPISAASEESPNEITVPYRWDTTDVTGTMRITEDNGLITHLVVTFD